MSYEEACSIMNDQDNEKSKSLKKIFRIVSYKPFSLPFYCFSVAPTTEKRLAQFLLLYRLYKENWYRTASHFQLEDFARVTLFQNSIGMLYGVPKEEFFRQNNIYIQLGENSSL